MMNLYDIKKIGFNTAVLNDDEQLITTFLLNKGLEFFSPSYNIEIKEKKAIILNSKDGNLTINADKHEIMAYNDEIKISIKPDNTTKLYSLECVKNIDGELETEKIAIDNSETLAFEYHYNKDEYNFNCTVKTAGVHHQKRYYVESDTKGAVINKKRLDYIPTSISEQGYNDIYFLNEMYDYVQDIKAKDTEKYNNPNKKLIKRKKRA